MDFIASEPSDPPSEPTSLHRRRPRYAGKNPRHFEDKYKEHSRDPETLAKVRASGKTPAGTHRPIMVTEILEVLDPLAGERAVDGTLGFGGHARALMERLNPGGTLLGLDADPVELPKTEASLRAEGYDENRLIVRRANFAGLPRLLAEVGWSDGVDMIFADLGVSSMQLDNPARGFSMKLDGPLDMRLNPKHGIPVSQWLQKTTPSEVARALVLGGDEPRATQLGEALSGKVFSSTLALVRAIKELVPESESEITLRRVFQALRIAVNDEFSAIDSLLRALPQCLRPGGKVAFLSFHSGEDRRVKQAFAQGLKSGVYGAISEEVIRASATEQHDNPRAASAKLRWAQRAEP